MPKAVPHHAVNWLARLAQSEVQLSSGSVVLQELGATVQQRRSDYVYATWSLAGPAAGGLVDMEFLFAQNDNTVRQPGNGNAWQK